MQKFNHNNIIKDLSSLIRLLKKYKFEDNNSIELYRLQNLAGKSGVFYEYNTVDMVFNVSTSGMSVKPSSIKKIAVILDLSYELQAIQNDTSDCFKCYSLNLHLKGFDAKDEFSNFFCWHLDREIRTDGDYCRHYLIKCVSKKVKAWIFII